LTPRARGIAACLNTLPPRVLLIFAALALKLPTYWLTDSGVVSGPLVRPLLMLPWLAWLALLFLMTMPETDRFILESLPWFRKTARSLALAAAVFAVVGAFALIAPGTLAQVTARSGLIPAHEAWLGRTGTFGDYSDSTALVHQGARHLLQGENPYAGANILEAFDPRIMWRVTALRTGEFAASFPYPSLKLRQEVWDRAAAGRRAPPEFNLRLSYPAGSFLAVTPFVWAGIPDIRLAYLIYLLAALAVTLVLLPGRYRLVFAFIFFASLELWFAVADGETGTPLLLFLLPAWLLRGRRPWWSAALLGAALAIKQPAWFLAPFYLIWVYQDAGWKRALKSAGMAAGVFLAVNLPFLAQDPALWLGSVTAPMLDPLFPAGLGPVSLVTGGLIDVRSSLPFAIMEGLALLAGLAWYFRHGRRYPQTAPLLAVLPLFFAWRSQPSYFMYADLMVLAGIMTEGIPGRLSPSREADTRVSPQ
jgi:hypothetical protein